LFNDNWPIPSELDGPDHEKMAKLQTGLCAHNIRIDLKTPKPVLCVLAAQLLQIVKKNQSDLLGPLSLSDAGIISYNLQSIKTCSVKTVEINGITHFVATMDCRDSKLDIHLKEIGKQAETINECLGL